MHLWHQMGSANRRALRNIYIIYIVYKKSFVPTQNVFNIVRNLNIIYTIYTIYIYTYSKEFEQIYYKSIFVKNTHNNIMIGILHFIWGLIYDRIKKCQNIKINYELYVFDTLFIFHSINYTYSVRRAMYADHVTNLT